MFEIEDKKLVISDELNRKIELICRFALVCKCQHKMLQKFQY